MSDALKVRCPTCDARVGVACRSTAVQYRPGKLYRAHTARVRAAREALVRHVVEAVAHTRACPGVPTEAMAYRVLVRPDGDDGHDRITQLIAGVGVIIGVGVLVTSFRWLGLWVFVGLTVTNLVFHGIQRRRRRQRAERRYWLGGQNGEA